MIRDGNLKFVEGGRPGVYLGEESPYTVTEGFVPFSSGYPLFGNICQPIDLQAAMDLGNGRPLTARFQIRSNFACADPAVKIRWALAVADDNVGGLVNLAGYTSNLMLLAQSRTFAIGSMILTAGGFNPVYNLPVPSISRIHVTGGPAVGSSHLRGRQYLYAGMVVISHPFTPGTGAANGSALTPGVSQCFTAGSCDAMLVLDPPNTVEFKAVGYPVVTVPGSPI